MSLVIAIDGPAASGKGTLARRLAAHYGLEHLDTGLLYRATAAGVLARGGNLDNEAEAAAIAQTLDCATLDRETLSHHEISEAASKVAAFPGVRRALFDLQRQFATREGGAVLDGRDITTVICPDATVKLFVTASPEVRARRRFDEAQAKGNNASYAVILDDIQRRDARDSMRTEAPLTNTGSAHLIDTTQMDIETAFRQACAFVEQSRRTG